MTSQAVAERVRRTIVERLSLDVEPTELDPSTSLIDGFGLDSAGLLQLVVGLEEEFDVTIEDHELTRGTFEDVASLTTLIDGKLRQ